MWISKTISQKKPSELSQQGTVTLSSSDGIEASATDSGRDYPCYAPYGYTYTAPAGEEVLLVRTESGGAVSGSRMKTGVLPSGEIKIKSAGGAEIWLRNDGSVVINGLIINRYGEIEE